MRRSARALVLTATTVLTVTILVAATVGAQAAGEVTLTGRVDHGSDNADFDPTTLTVTLNVIEGITTFDPVSTNPSNDGTFTFDVVDAPQRVYFISVDYEGASYSASLLSGELDQTMIVTVFESTHDSAVLEFDSYWVIVNGAVRNEGWVEIEERARVSNRSGKTLVFDQDEAGPGMLSFLRFALPPGAYNLAVGSSIEGGQILEVDRGFALTVPVPPTDGNPHAFNFVYRLPYDQDTLDLSRTMRFGAESFVYVTPEDVGRLSSPQLEDLGTTDIDGRVFQLMEGAGIEPAEHVQLSVSGLPLPTAWTRFTREAGKTYMTIAIPGFLATGLALLLVYGFRRRSTGLQLAPGLDHARSHHTLLAEAAALEVRLKNGNVSQRRYDEERSGLKGQLVHLELDEQLGDTPED